MSTSTEDTRKKESSNKNNIEIISNWYQSYYLWNTAYIYKAILDYNNPVTSHQNLNIPICQNTNQFNNNNNNNNNNPLNQNQTGQNNSVLNNNINNQIRRYKVPSLLKRFLAELFDAVYIQCCKIVLAIIVLSYTDIIDENSFRLFDFIEDILNEENLNNLRLPMELLILEIVYVLISVIFEAYCLYKKGYTPGKYLFNLRVITCVRVIENVNDNTIQVIPGTQMCLKSILLRTFLKNFSIVFLFPTILFFILPAFSESGQTSYDKAANSIVVEGL